MEKSTQLLNTEPMTNYDHMPQLYNEILKDYHYRFPKYSAIDYPTPPKSSEPVLKQRPLYPPTK